MFTTPVPCGRCPECVNLKIKNWSFRLNKELERSSTPLFLTLTYDDDNILYSGSGLPTLYKRDVQLFLKRLRKMYSKISDKSIKYYFVGEYGTKSKRPHYHAIMFNMDNPELIQLAWQKGFTYTPPLLAGGVRYVLKYMSKQRLPKDDDRLPEFSLMSKRMGENYLTDTMVNWHNAHVKNSFVLDDGYKMSIPKYFKDKIYDTSMRAEVTYYLQTRLEEMQTKKVRDMMRKDRKLNENLTLTRLEERKLHTKFDERNETL